MSPRGLILIALISFSFPNIDLYAQDQAPEPIFRKGDYWRFRVQEENMTYSTRSLGGEYELTYNGKTFVITQGDGANLRFVAKEQSEVGILFAMVGRGMFHGGQFLKFPLFVGQRWDLEYSMVIRGDSRPLRFSARNEVLNIETLSTPAGTFRTFKIIRSFENRKFGTFTYNYSDETKSIVKIVYDFQESNGGTRIVELMNFGSNCGLECKKEQKP